MNDERELHFGRGISFPVRKFTVKKHAALGKSGGGKTGLAKVLLEQALEEDVAVVVIDPLGIHYGLRSSFMGDKPGYKIVVFGGEHADIPINRNSGADLAKLIVEKNLSCVIDLTGMRKSEWRQLCTDFLDDLFRLNRTPRLVVLEECKEFVPQMIGPAVSGLYEAASRAILQGRNRGLGWVMIGQRPASINKEVLSQVDTLFMFSSISPQDRKALGEWVEAWDVEDKFDDFLKVLATLQERECYAWSPSVFKIFKAFKVKEFKTFHPDTTHLETHGLMDVKPVLADVGNITEMLKGSLKALVEEKADQARVPQLKRRIAELEAMLAKGFPKVAEAASGIDAKVVEKKIRQAIEEERLRLLAIFKKYETKVTGVFRSAQTINNVALKDLPATVEKALHELNEAKEYADEMKTPGKAGAPHIRETTIQSVKQGLTRAVNQPTHLSVKQPTRQPVNPPTRQPTDQPTDEVPLQNAHIKLLQAIARLNSIGVEKPSRAQVAVWSGYAVKGGSFRTYLSRVSAGGYIRYEGKQVILTEEGLAVAGEVPPPPSQEELNRTIREVIGESRWKILDVAMNVYPESITREELAEKSGYAMQGGSFRTYLSRLSALELVEYTAGNGVKASAVVFAGGGA